MLTRLLVGLLRPNPDKFLEDIPHLDAVDACGSEIVMAKALNDEVKQILLGRLSDLRVEAEPLPDSTDVGRDGVDVTRRPAFRQVRNP